jgi:tRNA(Phe) wybutosine-synthesizing methylase Tyw3
MDSNIFTFPDNTSKPGRRSTHVSKSEDEPRQKVRIRSDRSMHTFLFRSRELILESDEADLVRDVCLNIDRAQVKLRQLRERLQGVQE